MRISTATLFESGTAAMLSQQQRLFRLQEQVSSGRRLLTAADDPLGAAHALQARQADAVNDQYRVNRDAAQARLGLVEDGLSRYVGIIQNVRERALGALNGGLSPQDRRTLAVDIASLAEELLALANARDGQGDYLFSGFRADVQPFARAGGGVGYSGDEGSRKIAVAPSRSVPISVPGSVAFERIRGGNGVFEVAAAPANAGGAVVGATAVLNPAALTGHAYEIVFAVAGAATTYDVVDTSTATTVVSGQPYISGSAITFDGLRLEVSGAPASADRLTVTPSADRSVFQTLDELVLALGGAGTGTSDPARMANAVNAALLNLDRVLDRALSLQGGAGAALRELDSLGVAAEHAGLLNKQEISRLEDLDLARAVSELTRAQVGLEAAQKAFARVAGLTLFDYL